ncbi:MAG: excinuclease ABC subunit UvrA [Nitrospirae bacterium]|nr:excinuclease ABC subunit UvrA [Nitrospirota bacterium]
MEQHSIIIRGAREHNLKNIDVVIPRDKLVVITGLSGSGKSSLAFDTIYAEGQRRYVESLSAYARQFLEQMSKPEVDSIDGLSPAISIEQKTTSRNPRSTVGTTTEIYDYLRLLFARIGHPYCYQCGKEITAQTVQQMVDRVLDLPPETKLQILAPIVRGRKGEYRKEFADMKGKGFVRARIDGEVRELEEEIALDKNRKHTIEIVIDRLILKKRADEPPMSPGSQRMMKIPLNPPFSKGEIRFPPLEKGVEGGFEKGFSDEKLRRRLADSIEIALRLADGIVVINRIDDKDILFSERLACIACGISYPELTPRVFSFNSPHGACPDCDGLGVKIMHEDYEDGEVCPSCNGNRLKKESLSIRIEGKSIADVARLSINSAVRFFNALRFSRREAFIADRILKEIRERLHFLSNVGLDYLTLDREASTLSGGEGQRIRLATQIGSSLVGVIYVLDEPSIGLHQRDNIRLLATLKRLRDLGNTVLVVEHDEETIRESDYVIDMGPGAGEHGGEIVATGTPEEIIKDKNSLTGRYLAGEFTISLPERHRRPAKYLTIKGARKNNLKNIDISIPTGLFTAITGVSGSGKSTLVFEVLYKNLSNRLYRRSKTYEECNDILGLEEFDKVINIDQSPIGRTPRSNPATYTGVFTYIRDLYAQLPESRMRGYRAGRYSFNVKGGRCEACQGDGLIKIGMHFLPDVYVTCEVCKGKRYNRETLDVRYKGKNIAEVLDMTVAHALGFFEPIPVIRQKLETLGDVGLDYIRLGQAATTLSGGEAQRVKLSKELSRRATGRTIYILDEPTTGLHFADIQRLLDVLNKLVDSGNSVVVIEHHPDVIKNADYIIDLGPEGGDAGGEVVAYGAPEDVARVERSYTGRLLRGIVAG